MSIKVTVDHTTKGPVLIQSLMVGEYFCFDEFPDSVYEIKTEGYFTRAFPGYSYERVNHPLQGCYTDKPITRLQIKEVIFERRPESC